MADTDAAAAIVACPHATVRWSTRCARHRRLRLCSASEPGLSRSVRQTTASDSRLSDESCSLSAMGSSSAMGLRISRGSLSALDYCTLPQTVLDSVVDREEYPRTALGCHSLAPSLNGSATQTDLATAPDCTSSACTALPSAPAVRVV